MNEHIAVRHIAPTRVETLAAELERALRTAYEPGMDHSGLDGVPLREAFEQFGASAVASAVPIEDSMAVAAVALQELFERTGGHGADPGTALAAGIALGAVSREYARFQSKLDGSQVEMQVPTQVARLRALHSINRAATAGMSVSSLLETSAQQVAE